MKVLAALALVAVTLVASTADAEEPSPARRKNPPQMLFSTRAAIAVAPSRIIGRGELDHALEARGLGSLDPWGVEVDLSFGIGVERAFLDMHFRERFRTDGGPSLSVGGIGVGAGYYVIDWRPLRVAPVVEITATDARLHLEGDPLRQPDTSLPAFEQYLDAPGREKTLEASAATLRLSILVELAHIGGAGEPGMLGGVRVGVRPTYQLPLSRAEWHLRFEDQTFAGPKAPLHSFALLFEVGGAFGFGN